MGGCNAVVLNVVFVSDDPEEIAESVGFSPSIFRGNEWETLKTFCNKKRIKQKELNRVFTRFLSHPEVYLRKFGVRYSDIKAYFMKHSRLMQEICDTLVPLIYYKDYVGLEKVANPPSDDVSFARFIIMSFIFNNQPIPDLIFDFVATLRMKLALKLNMAIFRFNFEQIIQVIAEDVAPCITLSVILDYCNPQNDLEINVQSLMLMCLKYPLAFYPLIRFRNHYRRLVFGDTFWVGRKPLKSRFVSKMNLDGDYESSFASEASARRETARALVSDCLMQTGPKLALDEELADDLLLTISTEAYNKVKSMLGYKYARGLIMEAELELDEVFPLFKGTEIGKYTEKLEAHANKIINPFFEGESLFGSESESELNDGGSVVSGTDISATDSKGKKSRGKKKRDKSALEDVPPETNDSGALIPMEMPGEDDNSSVGTGRRSRIGTRNMGRKQGSVMSELKEDDSEAHSPGQPVDPLAPQRILDKKIGYEFFYSVETGEREWLRRYEDLGGSLLKEQCTIYPQDMLVDPFRGRNDHPATVLGSPLKRKLDKKK